LILLFLKRLTAFVAWRVDFNLGLPSFESDIKGLRNMVDLALATNSLLVFVSSVGIFQRKQCRCAQMSWTLILLTGFMYAKTRPFPEDSLPAEVASGGGYAQSKWVSEQIMQSAASSAGLRAVVVRLGQACGSPNGSWNSKEWLPAIVKSAPILKCLPDDSRVSRASLIGAILGYLTVLVANVVDSRRHGRLRSQRFLGCLRIRDRGQALLRASDSSTTHPMVNFGSHDCIQTQSRSRSVRTMAGKARAGRQDRTKCRKENLGSQDPIFLSRDGVDLG